MLVLLPTPKVAQADSDFKDRTHDASETALRPARGLLTHTVTLHWQRNVGARASDWPRASHWHGAAAASGARAPSHRDSGGPGHGPSPSLLVPFKLAP